MKNKIKAYEPVQFSSRPETLGASTPSLSHISTLKDKIVFLGIPDDRGIANNAGYLGAAKGPEAFRKNFYKLYDTKVGPHFLSENIADVGDIVNGDSIEETHTRLTEVLHHILQQEPSCVFVIGGGHDFSYASYHAHTMYKSDLLPIINLDAHLDLRKPGEDGSINSGTPFYRIIENHPTHIAKGEAFFELGIQRDRNPRSLLEYAIQHKIKMVECKATHMEWPDMISGEHKTPLKHVLDHLNTCSRLGWSAQKSSFHLSLDIDVFASNIAMGTSAATPFGASLAQLEPVLMYFAQQPFCKIIDVAELCPTRDINEQTARLVAGLIYRMIELRLQKVAPA